jgi:hypothetical protein
MTYRQLLKAMKRATELENNHNRLISFFQKEESPWDDAHLTAMLTRLNGELDKEINER